MNSSRFKISDRIMSILLVVLIVVGVMPTTTFAQAAENPKTPETPKFIFSVESFEDGKALSAELSYSVLIDDKVKIEEKSLSIDDEGKAEIEEIAALEENITNSNVVLIYKVTKNDYKDVSGEYEIKKADDTLSVKLEKIEKVSVTVNLNESNGGIVEIDNESVDGTIKVNKGKEIEIKISTKAAEEFENYKGFHIKSVKINEEDQKLDDNNLNNFSKTVKADDNINIDVEFEKYYSFTIEKYSEDCGIVTVNDEKYESGNFDESSQVKLDIKSNEGYRISSILINDESEELNDFDKYSKTFYLDKNTSVKVEFVKIYIVNIKYDSSNGKVETDPEIESDGGLVQIGDGSTLHIKAIPNENFRVSNVSVTGFQEEIYDNNNFSIDNPYEKDLEIKQDAEISITFAPMVYKISLGNVSPNGSVTIENNNRTVDYDKTSVIKFIPDKGYKVGKILSNGEDVNDFIKPSEIEDGVYILTLNNVKEDKVLDISFIESEKADFDKVEISYSDSEKPLRTEKNDAYNLYVFRNGASAVLKPSDSNIGIRINDAEGVLYDNHEYTIEEDFTIEKIELFYDLGWHEVELENKSIKIAFDSKAPVVQITTESKNTGDFYTSDVDLKFSVKDPDYSSAIKSVKYTIEYDGQEKLFEEKIYTYSEGDEYQTHLDLKETIKAEDFNYDNVKVRLFAEDFAGYTNEDVFELNILTTKPKITADIDGELLKEAKEGYYNKARTAYITFEDRPSAFDKAGVLFEIKKDGKTVDDVSSMIKWTDDNDSSEKGIYKAEISFTEDGEYEWNVSYKNKAGLENEETTDKDGNTITDSTVYNFTIDKVAPTGKISIDKAVWEKLIEELTFGVWKNKEIKVEVTSEDNLSSIKYYKQTFDDDLAKSNFSPDPKSINELIEIYDNEEFVAEPYVVNADEQFVIYARLADYAGNVSYISTDGVVYDATGSSEQIEITAEKPHSNEYYNTDFDVNVIVNEKVESTKVYSGLNLVSYEVYCNEKKTQSGILFDKTANPDKPENEKALVSETRKSFKIDAAKNNSDNVKAVVTAVDNAGNEYSKEAYFKINVDKPTVSIEFDNNEVKKTKDERGYFNNSRTATLTFIDRETTFDEEAAINGIVIEESVDSKGKPVVYDEEAKKYVTIDPKTLLGEWVHDDNKHTITINFDKDANYKWTYKGYTNKSGNQSTDINVENGTVTPFVFTVDTNKPKGTVTVGNSSWQALLETLTFGLYTREKVYISATSTDVTSGTGIEYYKTSNTKALTFDALEKVTDWIEFSGSDLENNGVSPNERFTVYLKITDDAGNYSYISSNGYIIENEHSKITITPETPNENGIYGYKDYHNGINIDVKVTDPEPYSGIKTIDYWVECDGKKTQEGNLFTFNITNPTHEQLKNEITKSITVDPMINNSCNTVVYVKTVDNAGNEFINHADLDIDMTIPTVKVVYSDTSNENAKEGFYTSRTAKVYITERPHHFNKDKATESIKITSVDYFGNKVTDSYSIGEWNLAGAEDGDNTTYAATVTFDEDANYTFNVEYYDNADNTNNGIDFADQTAPSKFTVDKTKPTGSVTVDNNPWNKLINILTFGLFKNIKVDVSATSSDATSDTYIEYYKTSKADALTINELEEITDWTAFKGSALEKNGVSPNEQFVIYLKITDNAGNYDYISSDGFIVDNVHSVIEISPATANKNNAYGLDYNGNVNVGIKVTDPEPYSGIKTVEYWVECDGKETQRENLFTFNVKAPTQKQLKNEWTGTVTVKQKDNNSTDTKIYVKTIDNAGNEYTQSTPLDIDITEPGIKVTYEDTSNANAKEGFFTSRKATIVITERNNHFDSETATQGIKITAVDANGKNVSNSYTLSDWETVENKEYDKTTHKATIDFNKDANYTFSIEYIDKADNNNLPVDVTGQTTPYKFTVDTNKPTGSITVENNSWAELIKILTFGLFKNTRVDVKADSNDKTSNTIIEYYKTSKTEAMTVTELDKLNEWTSFKNSSLEKNGVSPNEQFVIYLKITDDAGNYTYISSDGYIVDDVASNIVITPEAPNRNNLYGLKYSNGIKVDVDVEDSEPYSGIKTVDYWVESDGVRTQEENLFTFNIDSPTQSQLVNKWTGSFKVDPFKNNSCNTNVYVKTVDNAGNEKTENITIDIDVTRPNIKIEYNSTSNANAREGYFTSRTATITITERTHHFNSANATNNIKITAADISGNAIESSYSISDWSTQEGITPDSAIHTATIWYNADANYKFSINYTDNADNENTEPDVTNQITPYEFTVDKTRPTGTVTASSAEGRTETWSSLVDSLRFGFWSKSRISVSGTSNDVTSPIASVQYYMPIAKNAVDETEALMSSDLDKVSNWTDFNGFDVTANNQFTVYIRIVDYAGNYTYIGTNGLIVDDQHPVDESVAPEITVSPEYPLNGIYKGDVNVSIQVDDPLVSGTYSGLKEITYSIFDRASANPNSPTQSGTLYTFNNSDPKQSELLKTWTGNIKVDSSVNNSNEIQIVVYAVDNAGNAGDNSQQGSQGYTVIKIDVTAPTIDISYNNNNADNKTFFNAERVATVRVTERNFDSKDVKVTITNTDGVVPSIVGWNSTSGNYNGDDSVHTATITYSADGDYKFEIEYTDLAGNKCSRVSYADGSVAPTEFTIDKTLPTVSVAYDNNSAQNVNYYKNNRTATITVNEHNFDSSRVTVSITASNDGNSVTIPTVNGWNSAGNLHTATVLFSKDALYTFDISVKDKANNTSAAFEKQSFYIDKTAPTVKISGVTDQSANKGDCIPVITYSDTNFDSKQMTISLVGVNRKNVEPTGQYYDIHNGKIFTFNNFAKEKNIDDIYTLSASLKDKAGNSTTDKINFSVNRFGSVYTLSDETVSLNGSYSKSPVDIVLTETNANKLKNIKITVFKNNETIVFKEDEDYNVEITGGNGKWYEYKYTLFKKNFEEDGIYRITIHSEDDAGNVAENTLDTKDMELSFGIDKTPPTVNVKNLESGETYPVENLKVHFSVNDNLKLTSVVVYLDNEKVQEWKDIKLSEIIDNGEDFSINVSGESTHAHNLSIIATDSAENEITEEINNFYVTTNLAVRYINNKPLFFGSISGVILLIGFIVFIVSFKRKKK